MAGIWKKLFITGAAVLLAAPVLADDVALVWAQPGKRSMEIVYSTYDKGQWSEPFYLTDNRLDDATPAIVGDVDGNIWVMWAEANGVFASSLKYRIKDIASGQWGDIQTFDTGFGFNSLPSLVRDKNNRLWAFWAAVDGEDDEIYYSVFGAGKWRKPNRINPVDNKVPDILPQPVLLENGLPSVTWLGFDTKTSQYRYFRSDWDGKKWTKPRANVPNPFTEKSLAEDIKLPTDIEKNTAALYDRRRYPSEAFYFSRGL